MYCKSKIAKPLNKIVEILQRNDLLVSCDNFPKKDSILTYYPESDSRVLDSNIDESDCNTFTVLKAFICIKGTIADGHDYIEEAIAKSVKLIITEKKIQKVDVSSIVVKNTRKSLALIAKIFFDNPSEDIFLIGVTGTNGKTSIVKIIEHILLKQNLSVATIGTLGYTINGIGYPLERTTPDITELNMILKSFVDKNIKYVVMEVSSHALKLDRVFGLQFKCAIFTNLSRDHLDFHHNMDDYYYSKSLLFDYLSTNQGFALINTDNEYGRKLFNDKVHKVLTYGISESNASSNILHQSKENNDSSSIMKEELSGAITYKIVEKNLDKTLICLSVDWDKILTSIKQQKLKKPVNYATTNSETENNRSKSNRDRALCQSFSTRLIGDYNVFNITAAIVISTYILINDSENNIVTSQYSRNFCLENQFKKVILSLPLSIKGRLELVEPAKPNRCYVDYAHTPEALELSCKTLKELLLKIDHCKNTVAKKKQRLICVFGAGGNRDQGKRSEMTNAVLKYADLVIITSDNPREENIIDIIFDMIKNCHPMLPYWIIIDRRKAIQNAVKIASEGDIVLIAGKGHEKFQTIGSNKIPFDDYEVCKESLYGKNKNIATVDNQKNYSNPTTSLDVPIDMLQVMLLLYLCSNKDLAVNRWDEDIPTITIDPMNIVRKKIVDHFAELEKRFDSNAQINHNNLPGFYINNISTDTRTIRDKSLFIALKGENFDGHNYVDAALKFSGNFAIVNKNYKLKTCRKLDMMVFVDDTLSALAIIAKKYRTLFNPYYVAITGSTGKTSVKEYCSNILSQQAPTLKNIANENNIIGITRTLFNLKSIYKYVVLELGTNNKGEMQKMADTVQPDIGIINNIGACHLEAFENLQGVYKEKICLLKRNLIYRIIPADNELFKELSIPAVELAQYDSFREGHFGGESVNYENQFEDLGFEQKLYCFDYNNHKPCQISQKKSNLSKNRTISNNNCFYIVYNKSQGINVNNHEDRKQTSNIDKSNDHIDKIRKNDNMVYYLPTDIPFLSQNAAYAITQALLLGLSFDKIRYGLLKKQKLNARMENIYVNNNRILFDCYNANPHSMKQAISYWAEIESNTTHIAILGDMLELGYESKKYHQQIGNFIKEKTADKTYKTLVYTVGSNAELYSGNFHFSSVSKLMSLKGNNNPLNMNNALILIKASRGIGLEEILGR